MLAPVDILISTEENHSTIMMILVKGRTSTVEMVEGSKEHLKDSDGNLYVENPPADFMWITGLRATSNGGINRNAKKVLQETKEIVYTILSIFSIISHNKPLLFQCRETMAKIIIRLIKSKWEFLSAEILATGITYEEDEKVISENDHIIKVEYRA